MKLCARCKEEKALTEFHRSKRDGYKSRCKACVKAGDKAYKAINRERISAQRKAAYAASPEVARERDKAYRVAKPELIAARRQAHYEANRERLLGVSSIYAKAHPEVGWACGYRRRARAYGFDPVVESFDRTDVIDTYGDACAHCGGLFEELDHHPVPVALGGAHTLANVRPSCATCNRGQSGTVRVARNINRTTEQVLDLVIQGLTEQGSPVG